MRDIYDQVFDKDPKNNWIIQFSFTKALNIFYKSTNKPKIIK